MRCFVVMTVRFVSGCRAVARRLWSTGCGHFGGAATGCGAATGGGAATFWMWKSAGATARLAAFFDVVLSDRAYNSTADGSEKAVASLLANVGAGSTAAQGS
jgi:hypothetical protein